MHIGKNDARELLGAEDIAQLCCTRGNHQGGVNIGRRGGQLGEQLVDKG